MLRIYLSQMRIYVPTCVGLIFNRDVRTSIYGYGMILIPVVLTLISW